MRQLCRTLGGLTLPGLVVAVGGIALASPATAQDAAQQPSAAAAPNPPPPADSRFRPENLHRPRRNQDTAAVAQRHQYQKRQTGRRRLPRFNISQSSSAIAS